MDENIIVSLKDIVVDFDGQKVLDGLSLDIHDKEFVTFLGPSGCGKIATEVVSNGFPKASTKANVIALSGIRIPTVLRFLYILGNDELVGKIKVNAPGKFFFNNLK